MKLNFYRLTNNLSQIHKQKDYFSKLSKKFDNYAPNKFKLTRSEIDAAMQKVSARDMDDIKFAQQQIKNFAEAQRASMTNLEIETMPDEKL